MSIYKVYKDNATTPIATWDDSQQPSGGGGTGGAGGSQDFATAVADAWTNDRVLNWEYGDVTLVSPIVLQASTGKFGFGIRGNGAKITCAFSDATKYAISIEVPIVSGAVVQNVNVRNFTIADINFRGSSAFAGALEFRCFSNGSWINSFLLENLTCENHSGRAYSFKGSIFEFILDKCKSTGGVGAVWIEKRGLNGTAGEGDQGLPSAMEMYSPNFRDGSGNSIELYCVDAYTEPFDLSLHGGYIVSNAGFGVKAPAGITLVDGVGFEANGGGCAMEIGYRGGVIKGGTRGANPTANAALGSPGVGMAYLVKWWGASGKLVLEDLQMTNEGAGTGPAKIASVDGGTVYLNRCGTQAAAIDSTGTPTVIVEAA